MAAPASSYAEPVLLALTVVLATLLMLLLLVSCMYLVLVFDHFQAR